MEIFTAIALLCSINSGIGNKVTSWKQVMNAKIKCQKEFVECMQKSGQNSNANSLTVCILKQKELFEYENYRRY